MVQHLLPYFTILWYLKKLDSIGKQYCGTATKPVHCSALVACTAVFKKLDGTGKQHCGISPLLRTAINILKEEYGTISVAILHGTALFKNTRRHRKTILQYLKKLDGIGKQHCGMVTKPVYCSALVACR